MPESDIAKSDIMENIENTLDTGKAYEKFTCIVDGHSEDFSNIFSFEFHIECFRVVSSPPTGFTLHIHIGKEVHLDLFHTTSLTYLTASSFGIERESSRAISSFLCFVGSCEYFTDIGKYSGIGSNIRVGCLPYR